MRTAAELAPFLGRRGLLSLPGASSSMSVAVEVRDAREDYSQVRLLVVPVAGQGEAWVDASRVKLEERDGADPPTAGQGS